MLNRELIVEHYREQALKWKDDARSTMEDETTREFEVTKIKKTIRLVAESMGKKTGELSICDLGCGNGYTLKELAEEIPANYYGMDISNDMLDIARGRNLKNTTFQQVDVTQTADLPNIGFDIIFTERCLINILDKSEQYTALENVGKMLNPGGCYIMLESFRDGLDLSNKAREEVGLDEINAPYHNLFFDKDEFLSFIEGRFRIVHVSDISNGDMAANWGENFLSSYYFMSRVVYPLITQREVMRNTEIVKFFSHMAPVGNYAPNQCYILARS